MSTSKPPVHDAPDISQHDRELFHRLRTLDDMIRASEETEDKLRRISERRRIPPVPDLRFEYSYTRSVSQYVHVERVPPPSSEKGKEKAMDGEEEQDSSAVAVGAGEVVRVDWRRVIWITTRDQVISPLVQGALWYVTYSSCCAALEHGLQGSCKPFPAPARRPGGCAHTRLVGERVTQGRRARRQRRAMAEELDGYYFDTDACYERFPPVTLTMLRLPNVQRIWTLGNKARRRLSTMRRRRSQSWPATLLRATLPTAYDLRALALPTRSPTCTATTRRTANGTTQAATSAVSSRDARGGIPSSSKQQPQCPRRFVTQDTPARGSTRRWKPCSRAATVDLCIFRAVER